MKAVVAGNQRYSSISPHFYFFMFYITGIYFCGNLTHGQTFMCSQQHSVGRMNDKRSNLCTIHQYYCVVVFSGNRFQLRLCCASRKEVKSNCSEPVGQRAGKHMQDVASPGVAFQETLMHPGSFYDTIYYGCKLLTASTRRSSRFLGGASSWRVCA